MAPSHKRHDVTLSNGTKISILEGIGSIYLMMSEANLEKGKVGSKVFAQITPWRVGLSPNDLTPEEWSRLMQPKGSLGLMPTAATTCSICYIVFPCISGSKAFYNRTKEDNGSNCTLCNRRVCEACIDGGVDETSIYPKAPVICKLCHKSSKDEFSSRAEAVITMIATDEEAAKAEDTIIAEQIAAIDAFANKALK
jgi:hypothetical protein